jgi:hypothetical protein
MKFLSILKAVGKGALTVSGLLQNKIVIAAEALLPAKAQPVVSEINQIASEIAVAEAIGQKMKDNFAATPQPAGATLADVSLAKARAVLPGVQEILRESNLLAGRKVADEDRFTLGCQKIIDGMVDVLDSVEHPNG